MGHLSETELRELPWGVERIEVAGNLDLLDNVRAFIFGSKDAYPKVGINTHDPKAEYFFNLFGYTVKRIFDHLADPQQEIKKDANGITVVIPDGIFPATMDNGARELVRSGQLTVVSGQEQNKRSLSISFSNHSGDLGAETGSVTFSYQPEAPGSVNLLYTLSFKDSVLGIEGQYEIPFRQTLPLPATA